MEGKDKLKLLQKKYNIPDKELIAMGLKQEETTNESTKVSEKEKEAIHEYCLKQDIFVSKYIRDTFTSLLIGSSEKRKRVASEVKKLEKDKKNRSMDTPVSYVLTKSRKKQLTEFCKQYNILNKSSVARYIIIETIRKGDCNDILSK